MKSIIENIAVRFFDAECKAMREGRKASDGNWIRYAVAWTALTVGVVAISMGMSVGALALVGTVAFIDGKRNRK